MKKAPFILFVLFSLSALTCKKEPPVVPPSPPPTGLDTTSHNFVFTQYTFGGLGGSSYFKDVAIVSDSNIWAVGAIYTTVDTMFNAAHWDGKTWKLLKIGFYTVCGQQSRTAYPTTSILAINLADIWITAGDQVTHLDGESQTATMCLPVSFTVNKLWGNSSNSIYAVGNGGNILYYSNDMWIKLESGTTLDLQDIWGATDTATGEQQILAVGTRNYPLDHVALSIHGNTVTPVSSYPIQYELFGVWFVPNQHYYVIGDGIYEKTSLTDSLWRNGPLDITHYATTGIRGNGLKDIIAVGAFGEVLHYNGSSWRSYHDVTNLANGSYTSVAIWENLVVAVGGNGNTAVITMGRR